jgi:hypothetical protein
LLLSLLASVAALLFLVLQHLARGGLLLTALLHLLLPELLSLTTRLLLQGLTLGLMPLPALLSRHTLRTALALLALPLFEGGALLRVTLVQATTFAPLIAALSDLRGARTVVLATLTRLVLSLAVSAFSGRICRGFRRRRADVHYIPLVYDGRHCCPPATATGAAQMRAASSISTKRLSFIQTLLCNRQNLSSYVS